MLKKIIAFVGFTMRRQIGTYSNLSAIIEESLAFFKSRVIVQSILPWSFIILIKILYLDDIKVLIIAILFRALKTLLKNNHLYLP